MRKVQVSQSSDCLAAVVSTTGFALRPGTSTVTVARASLHRGLGGCSE